MIVLIKSEVMISKIIFESDYEYNKIINISIDKRLKNSIKMT